MAAGTGVTIALLTGRDKGRARESILHMLYETNAWLDRYVKNRPADDAAR